jgi:hypothetical protein
VWSCRLESRECPQGGKENTDEPAAKRQRVDSDKNGDLAAKATQGHSQMTCSACTWENDSTAAHCEMCDTVLPAQKVFIVCCVLLRVISSHCRSQEEPGTSTSRLKMPELWWKHLSASIVVARLLRFRAIHVPCPNWTCVDFS